ncbi:MAG: response regulator [Deltaproteobacteria bacterium]|nr:response regulator [Deltaproteobacteria bacterium]
MNKKNKTELAETTLESLMSSTTNLIVILDELSRVRYISKPLADLAHIEDYEISVGRPILDLFPDMDMKLLISEIISSSEAFDQTAQLSLGGQTRYFKIVSNSYQGQSEGRFIDITDVSQIMDAKLEAEKSNATKRNFLAKMSHEIRTPMSAIVGMTDIILRDNLTARVRENALEVKQASLNLLTIINDILDISKIESGKMDLNIVNYDFIELLNGIISIIRIRAVEKSLQFVVNIDNYMPSKLSGDSNRIRQILLNILNNAIKYTDKGYIKLLINFRLISNDKINLKFTVNDSGIGIKEGDIENLFTEFTQFDSKKNRFVEGTGLGLAIAKNLANLMGGDILVSSQYGKGSQFTVSIPQGLVDPTPLAQIEGESPKVLALEARPVYAEALELTIKNFELAVALANNITEFEEYLAQEDYGLIMVSSKFYQAATDILKELKIKSLIVIMTEVEEIIVTDYLTISLPILPNYFANIVNHQTTGIKFSDFKTSINYFIAPTAAILVVDDIMTNLKVAEGLLEPYKCETILSKSGFEAIDIAKERPMDLILMDHMMPEIDGLETAARIQALQTSWPTPPIVALTANAVSGARELFEKAGFDGFLAKPIDINELHNILTRYIPEEKILFNVAGGGTKLAESTLAIPGLELEPTLAQTLGSEERYRDLLGVFYFDAWSRLSLLKSPPTAAYQDKLYDYIAAVHALKSAAYNIGAQAISKQMEELESLSQSKDWAGLAAAYPQALNDLTELLQLLNAKLNIETGEKVEIDEDQAKMLRQVQRSLTEGDVILAADLVEKMCFNHLSEDLQRQLDNISYCILAYELAEALSLVDRLLVDNLNDR